MSNADQAFCPFPRRSPMRLTMPYSVTTKLIWDRGSVTVVPGARVGRMLEFIAAGLLIVEGRAKGDDALAARRTISAVRKSDWPPLP